MSGTMPHTSIVMVRPTLAALPEAPLPMPYVFRPYVPGDEANWVRIHELADQYNKSTLALFVQQFGTDAKQLGERQFYLCDGAGDAIGTITAWQNEDYPGRNYGRVHWVAIVPEHQGKGLGRPLLAACLKRMAELGHDGAYLTTAPPRLAAINLYLRFGFVPDVQSREDQAAWRLLRYRVKEEFRDTVGAATVGRR